MRKVGYVLCALLLPALLIMAQGCGGGPTKPQKNGGGDGGDGGDGAVAKKTKLKVTKWGSLTGTVIYDGEPPPFSPEEELKTKDPAVCHSDKANKIELSKQTWLVNQENKGVANTVIYLVAPDGKYFPIKMEDTTRKETVELSQPHCNYVPHILTLYPEYTAGYDENDEPKRKTTGQEFIVTNTASISHNTTFKGDPFAKNKSYNLSLKPGDKTVINGEGKVELHPQREPIVFKCDIHKWMQGYGFVFDNPYHDVSEGGKLGAKADDWGKFHIKNVPAGVPLKIVVWHEGRYEITSPASFSGTPATKEITFMEGENKLDIKIKKK